MSTRMQVLALTTAVTVLSPPAAHCADWTSDFYNSVGSAKNITTGQAITSGGRQGYAGGSVTWRTPNKNFQPFQVTPPSFNIGCSGIDAYKGSFSYLGDNFKNALESLGNSSTLTAFAWELAMRTVSPEIQATLDVLNDVAQKINAININSCNAGKVAADALVDRFTDKEKKKQTADDVTDKAKDDWFGAKQWNDIKSKWATRRDSYRKQYGVDGPETLTEEQYCKDTPPATDFNLLSWALCNSDKNKVLNDSDIELAISLFGSAVHRTSVDTSKKEGATNDPVAPTLPEAIGGQLSIEDLIGIGDPKETVTTKIACNDGARKCLQWTVSGEQWTGYKRLVKEAFAEIRESILRRQAGQYRPGTQNVIKNSSLPIYKIAALSTVPGYVGAYVTSQLDTYAEIAAHDAAYHTVAKFHTMTVSALARASAKINPAWESQVSAVMQAANTKRQDAAAKYAELIKNTDGTPLATIDRLNALEKSAYANMNAQLASNYRAFRASN